jgi:N-acetyl-gamma-glutamyl-phosphate reductase
LVVDAKSGVSGAGRGLTQSTHFPEVGEGVRAYKAGVHRHGPEIEQELGRLAGGDVQITFVPHLVPMSRGILATCYAQPTASGVSADACTEAARALYAGSPSVHVLDSGQHPDTLWVRGSNRVHVGYVQDTRSGTVIAMSAIDNLVKGAAGQAVQCANVRFGLDEGEGLLRTAQWP